MDIYKAGNTILTKDDMERIIREDLYVVNYNGIYAPTIDKSTGRYKFSHRVIVKGLTSKGRFYLLTKSVINRAFGRKML